MPDLEANLQVYYGQPDLNPDDAESEEIFDLVSDWNLCPCGVENVRSYIESTLIPGMKESHTQNAYIVDASQIFDRQHPSGGIVDGIGRETFWEDILQKGSIVRQDDTRTLSVRRMELRSGQLFCTDRYEKGLADVVAQYPVKKLEALHL